MIAVIVIAGLCIAGFTLIKVAMWRAALRPACNLTEAVTTYKATNEHAWLLMRDRITSGNDDPQLLAALHDLGDARAVLNSELSKCGNG